MHVCAYKTHARALVCVCVWHARLLASVLQDRATFNEEREVGISSSLFKVSAKKDCPSFSC